MANSLSLVKIKPSHPLSAARQAMIEACALHQTVVRDAAAAREADEHAAGQVQAAEAALLAVRDRLDRAKKTLAAGVSASARGGPMADAGPLARIRMEEAGAIDVLEATVAARAELVAARTEAERREGYSGARLQTAANAIMDEAMPEMLEQAMVAQQQLVRFRMGLRWLIRTRAITATPAVMRFMDREAFLPRTEGGELDNGMQADWARLAGEAPWQAFMQTLQDDPAAPLPLSAVMGPTR